MERLEAVISGRVQGVMYRDFVQRKASGLKLTGEVVNLPDKTVHVTAEGERSKLEQLIIRLHKGSLFSEVRQVTVNWLPATGEFVTFKITRYVQ